ncbi:radical SAM protein [Candidatus Fermentibacteria bacterium]|nr:radical SAM protein [Candidatus Fermentibacteria bacterium]
MSIRVAVVNPPFMEGKFSRTSRSPAINKSGTLYWPFWLAYATGALERAGTEVRLLDCPATGTSEGDLQRALLDFRPRMVVLDTSTPSIYSDLRIASACKSVLPEAVVVLVGTHVSALPELCLRLAPSVDCVAVAEYDATLVDIARALEGERRLDDIPGLVLNLEGELVRTPERQPIADLDSLPLLADVYRRHLEPENYFFAAARYPSVMTITSRGCPFRCSFCVWPQVMHKGKYRARSAENVVEEFRRFAESFPQVQEVVVEDDTFATGSKRVEEVSEALIRAGNRLPWTANVRANLSLEAMRKMKKAACRLIIVGYESGSQEILDRVGKGTTVEQNLEFAERARKAGLLVHGCFMAGNPGETPATLRQTLRMAKRLSPDTAQFFPIMAYPGTRLYDEFKNEGLLRTESFDRWVTEEGLHNCVVDLPELPADELVRWCDMARREFYLRPSYLVYKALQSLRHPLTEGRRTLRAFATFRRYLFRRP